MLPGLQEVWVPPLLINRKDVGEGGRACPAPGEVHEGLAAQGGAPDLLPLADGFRAVPDQHGGYAFKPAPLGIATA